MRSLCAPSMRYPDSSSCPPLSSLRLQLLTFVTSRRPSTAVALAGSLTPVHVLVVAPQAQRQRVASLGVKHFAAFDGLCLLRRSETWRCLPTPQSAC